jgi:NDP-hexose-3-ketoreductase
MIRAAGPEEYESFQALLKDSSVEVVFITATTGSHFELVMEALEAGKAVWCEKPLGLDLAQTDAMLLKATETKCVLLESDMFLHHPQFTSLRAVLASAELGQVKSITARFGFPHLRQPNFRYDRASGGGALLDAGFYPSAAAVATLGPSVTLVAAGIERRPGGSVDTGGAALVESESGFGLLEWGFGRTYRNELEIWCEAGTVRLPRAFSKPPDYEAEVEIESSSGNRVVRVGPANHFRLMVDAFADATFESSAGSRQAMRLRASLLDQIRNCRQ